MLTVVIPSYNHQEYILECLRSASDISVPGLKILVIDDGSTDDTVKIVKHFMENGARATVELIEKENSGLVSSLNLCLKHVDTQFVFICASDDIPVPEGIKLCVEALSKESECRFIIGGARKLSNQRDLGNVYGEHQKYFLSAPLRSRKKMCFFDYPSPILIQSTIFRTQAIRDLGGWDPQLNLDDYPFFIDLLEKYPEYGLDFRFFPDIVTVFYRQHSSNSYRNTLRQFKLVSEVIENRAPAEIQAKAIANCASSYMLASARKSGWRDIFLIFGSLSYRERLLVFFYLPIQFFSKIKRRIYVANRNSAML